MDTTSTTGSDHTTVTRISNPTTLAVARLVVLVIGFASLFSFIEGISWLYNLLQTPSPEIEIALGRLGFSQVFYLAFSLGLPLIFGIISLGVAALIMLRRSDDRMGLVMAVFLMTFTSGVIGVGVPIATLNMQPVLLVVMSIMSTLGWALIETIFALFPDGKVPFRWLYIPIILQFVIAFLWSFAAYNSPLNPANWHPLLIGSLVVFEIVTAGYAIHWKYRHTLTPAQRQQAKWPAIGGVVAACIYATSMFVPLVFPQVYTDPAAKLLSGMYTNATVFALVLLPLTLTFAILRYRLWDVDVVVNRSLVYGIVTLVTLVVFFLVTLLVQSVLGSQQVGISLLISLVVAGLALNPVRKAAQRFVDRRLYGLKFDLNELNAAQKLPDIKNVGALSGRKLGSYNVLDAIGKGGMGEVYKGEANGQIVALKILPDDLAKQEEFRKRFEREAQTLTALNHPNIVHMLGSGTSDGILYLAMDYIDGEELGDKLKASVKLSLDEVRDIVKGLAAALDYAHEQGFVHRDIKPSNVMLRRGKNGETTDAVLMDFGVAKIREARTGLTSTGAIGTIDYMAPEQIMAAKAVDKRADVYALGVMLYEMLVGERPFKGGAAQVMFAHIQQPAPDPRDVNDDIPRSVAKAVQKAMEKKPEDRFTTAGELAEALSR